MNYESLIFDIDGTLWDSRALVAEGYNIQLEKEGLQHHIARTLRAMVRLGPTHSSRTSASSVSV